MKNKKSLSTVIATVLLILLAVVLVGVVWASITKIINDSRNRSESCFDLQEKVTLNAFYTCYNQTSKELMFSINIADKDVERALVSITVEGTSKSVELLASGSTFSNVRPYGGNYGANTTLPEKNAGLSYYYNLTASGFSGTISPTMIRIAPIIGGNQCDVTDTISEISACTS
jgi:FlaG/FlaF family flagellin (archaellin)